MDHRYIDQRSLELNCLVAEKIRARPELINIGLENIRDYMGKATASRPGKRAYLEWARIIKRHSIEEVLRILTEESEEGQRLRQSSPFVGIITQEERKAIFQKYEPFRTRAYSPSVG